MATATTSATIACGQSAEITGRAKVRFSTPSPTRCSGTTEAGKGETKNSFERVRMRWHVRSLLNISVVYTGLPERSGAESAELAKRRTTEPVSWIGMTKQTQPGAK